MKRNRRVVVSSRPPEEPLPRIAIEYPIPSDDFFERTKFKKWDLLVQLQQLYTDDRCPPEALDLVRAMFLAMLDMHRHFRLEVEEAEEGKVFRPHAKAERNIFAEALAYEIELAAAKGEKLESLVEAAHSKYELSRREVFRFLDEARERRRQLIEGAKLFDSPAPDFQLPPGFTVNEAGRIVPEVGKS